MNRRKMNTYTYKNREFLSSCEGRGGGGVQKNFVLTEIKSELSKRYSVVSLNQLRQICV
jgi:hypothetical protein